jgi:hypothetical protein
VLDSAAPLAAPPGSVAPDPGGATLLFRVSSRRMPESLSALDQLGLLVVEQESLAARHRPQRPGVRTRAAHT